MTPSQSRDEYSEAVERALALLGLDDKARLLAGQDVWTLPAMPQAGLGSLVMSDGPVGVRGVRWTPDDPSVALPSPTALAAAWDPGLARSAGRLLAQEAHRKGVHVLLAPTVNLHRSPLGGRHFEAYSEDPLLTGAVGSGFVQGVQDGGIGTTVKHFVANDAETDRFTVDNRVGPRALRELYLRPFEMIVRDARPWGVMTAYNSVNGPTMTEHRPLVRQVLRGEWGFDGINVSDWMAARDTVAAVSAGLDVAMPGPKTVYGPALAAAVREGRAEESDVDDAVRRVLRLAARVGLLEGVAPAVPAASRPEQVDGRALAREIARRSFVLVRNEGAALPLTADHGRAGRIALSGAAARDARILGGGSATVFPDRVVPPLEGLRAALPEGALTYSPGADPNDELAPAGAGFDLRAVCFSVDGNELGGEPLPVGKVQWMGDMPEGVTFGELHTVTITGTFTPRESGSHRFGIQGIGGFRLEVDGQTLFDGAQVPTGDAFEAVFGAPAERGTAALTEGRPVEVALTCTVPKPESLPIEAVVFALAHLGPQRDPQELIAEAVEAARDADTAVVVVATTDRVESEGFDRTDLALPGHQDALVRAVAEVNARTVVVVNSGSPVGMPWRDDVAAVLLSWFPGQEAGTALADVLTGVCEPGGRLPTTWPAALEDAPVTGVVPENGELHYDEGVFIGYRAWQRAGARPAYPFGHGLGYTEWTYGTARFDPAVDGGETGDGGELGTVTVRVRNTGSRPGREVVQLYLAPEDQDPAFPRPDRWLAGFAAVEADPGETAEAVIPVLRSAVEAWDATGVSAAGQQDPAYGREDPDPAYSGAWRVIPGKYSAEAGRSVSDVRVRVPFTVPSPQGG